MCDFHVSLFYGKITFTFIIYFLTVNLYLFRGKGWQWLSPLKSGLYTQCSYKAAPKDFKKISMYRNWKIKFVASYVFCYEMGNDFPFVSCSGTLYILLIVMCVAKSPKLCDPWKKEAQSSPCPRPPFLLLLLLSPAETFPKEQLSWAAALWEQTFGDEGLK